LLRERQVVSEFGVRVQPAAQGDEIAEVALRLGAEIRSGCRCCGTGHGCSFGPNGLCLRLYCATLAGGSPASAAGDCGRAASGGVDRVHGLLRPLPPRQRRSAETPACTSWSRHSTPVSSGAPPHAVPNMTFRPSGSSTVTTTSSTAIGGVPA